MLVLFCPQVAAGIWIASISTGVFAFNSSVYGIFPLLFPHVSILVGSTSDAVAESSSPWNTNDFVTPCPNLFLRFRSSRSPKRGRQPFINLRKWPNHNVWIPNWNSRTTTVVSVTISSRWRTSHSSLVIVQCSMAFHTILTREILLVLLAATASEKKISEYAGWQTRAR